MRRLARAGLIPGVLAACSLLAYPSPGSGQTTISGDPECPECSVSLELGTTFGASEVAGVLLPRYPRDAMSVGDDRFLMTFSRHQEPTWYSVAGAEIGRLGRRGEGPGEYELASVLLSLPGDSILVFDFLRATVVGPDGEDARTIRLDIMAKEALVVEWPAEVVVAADMLTPTSAGYSLHTLDLSESPGVRVKSFAENRPYNPNRSTIYQRTIAPVPSGGFVAAHISSYEFTRYDAVANQIESWTRVADWAPPNPGTVIGGPKTGPTWTLRDVHVDASDRLWVYTLVPRPDWKDAWEEAGIDELPRSGEIPNLPSTTELMQTRVEVFDLNRGVLLAQADLGTLVHRILPDGRLLLFVESEIGAPIVQLATPVLNQR